MNKKLTTEERTTIETLIKMGMESKHIADFTRRSISVIAKLRNGTYDMLNERKRVAEREKKKKEKAEESRAVKDAILKVIEQHMGVEFGNNGANSND